jgi:methylthioribose-1-phosphate isomerase
MLPWTMLQPRDVIRLEPGAVVMLDQTRLPLERVDLRCESVDELVLAIRRLAIRGAPAIGIAAAMGMALAAQTAGTDDAAELRAVLDDAARRLGASRPTAVNLAWALDECRALLADRPQAGAGELRAALHELAERIHRDEVARCEAMGAHGAALLPAGARILTHCNTGALATGGYGSALGVVRAAYARDPSVSVWVDETRPLLQGARLTAWELAEDGIAHTLIADSAAGQLFARGQVDAVIFGADRIAANGDVANKIGSYTLSVLARAHSVPCFVAAPTSTIDLALERGDAIPIEQRPAGEVAGYGPVRWSPPETPVANPAFDVTPAANVTAIVTERGVHRAPYGETLADSVRQSRERAVHALR